jgi:tetratricopeptide (TPR) repeat protein
MCIQLGDFPRALEQYEEAQRLNAETGDRDVAVFSERGLCLLYHYQGDHDMACRHGEQAIRILPEETDVDQRATTWIFLGHARFGQENWPAAAEAYQKAFDLLANALTDDTTLDARAGLAQVSLAQGNLVAAVGQVELILPYLISDYLDKTQEPLRVYHSCYHVLQAAADPRAEELLQKAQEKLHALASGLDDEQRGSFLGKNPINWELLAAVAGT